MNNLTFCTIGIASSVIYLVIKCATRKNPNIQHQSSPEALPPERVSSTVTSSSDPTSSVTPTDVKTDPVYPTVDHVDMSFVDTADFIDRMDDISDILSSEEPRSQASGGEASAGNSNEELDANDKTNEGMKLKTAKKDDAMGKTEQDVFLDATNPYLHFCVMEFKDGPAADVAAFVEAAKISGEQTASYHWAMKKRLDYDESTWKLMARKISLLKSEGFDCSPNTRVARELKESVFSGERKVEVKTQIAIDKIKKVKEKSKRRKPGKQGAGEA